MRRGLRLLLGSGVLLLLRLVPKAEAEEPPAPAVDGLLGDSGYLRALRRQVLRVARSEGDVLLSGPTGTGKELLARALHEASPRRAGPLVSVNVAAIPAELAAAQLFGAARGAFTGAERDRRGYFEQAAGGTLFLDEIGDMPAATQTRLLRVLQDGEFFRVGGVDSIKADVRIIAATHQKLESLVETGAFREDLFHRLNVIRIHVPKLSERREDIPRLLTHFLTAASAELDVETKTLSEDALQVLTQLPWPGNVRQLENTCRWLTVMAAGREVLLSDLPTELLQHQDEMPEGVAESWHEQLARVASLAGRSDLRHH